jgi:hypothetical protein
MRGAGCTVGKKQGQVRSALEAALTSAVEDLVAVRIKRSLPRTLALTGYVVGLSAYWVVVAETDGAHAPEGWTVIRRADIEKVRPVKLPDLTQRLLEARGFWPPSSLPASIDLTSAQTIAKTGSDEFGLVMLEREIKLPGTGRVGRVLDISGRKIIMQEVDPAAEWDEYPTAFDSRDVTSIDIADGYLLALALVAGPPPVV